MRNPNLVLALVTLSLSAALPAQNLVKNGDFAGDLTNWSGSGDGGSPGIANQDVTGLGAGKCFSVYPGGNTYNPPHAPYVLKQNLLALPTMLELRMDVWLLLSATNAQGGVIDVKLGTQTIGTWQRFVASTPPGTHRDQLCFRFQSTQSGLQDLAIEMGRPLFAWSIGRTPLMAIDNVSLRIAGDPIVCMPGERREGTQVALRLMGQANAAVALFVASGLLPSPVKIPGWAGTLDLDPTTMFFVLSGALDGSGELKGALVPPNGIGGIPLFWQGIQITASAQGIGNLAPINFYK